MIDTGTKVYLSDTEHAELLQSLSRLFDPDEEAKWSWVGSRDVWKWSAMSEKHRTEVRRETHREGP